MRAACGLSSAGFKTAVITKLFPYRSNTVSAQYGINVALAKNDLWQYHFNDTVKSSFGLGDQKAIRYMTSEAFNTITELKNNGMPFSLNEDGSIKQRAYGDLSSNKNKSNKVNRCCFAENSTGYHLINTLYKQVSH